MASSKTQLKELADKHTKDGVALKRPDFVERPDKKFQCTVQFLIPQNGNGTSFIEENGVGASKKEAEEAACQKLLIRKQVKKLLIKGTTASNQPRKSVDKKSVPTTANMSTSTENSIPMKEILEIFSEDTELIRGWVRFSDSLNIPHLKTEELRNWYRTNSDQTYELIRTLLLNWITCQGSNATINVLLNALDHDGNKHLKDKLQSEYKPQQIVTVS